jgi:hypothetical protein
MFVKDIETFEQFINRNNRIKKLLYAKDTVKDKNKLPYTKYGFMSALSLDCVILVYEIPSHDHTSCHQ